MASRAGIRRVLPLTALSLAVVISSVVVSESGGAGAESGASTQAEPQPRNLALAPLRQSGGAGTQCLVTPRTPSSSRPRPLLIALGASFTAGVGADGPAQSWAVRLAELIRWRALTIGVPGAGYAASGLDHLGPLSEEAVRAHLAALQPSLIIIQAGHDDVGIPRAAEAAHVARLVGRLRAAAPGARLAFLTVFSRPDPGGPVLDQELSTDSTIVAAIRKADARAFVIDPLRAHWRFPRDDGGMGLHPSSRGHLVIAELVARALARAGVVAGAASRPQPAMVTCGHLAPAGEPLRSGKLQQSPGLTGNDSAG
jgi:acyl-CoA thioesterase I